MSIPSTKDPVLADHLAWLGYVQPEGLVVSAPAWVDSQVVIDRAALPDLQRRLAEHVSSLALTASDTGDTVAGVADLPRFLTEFLGWPADLLVGWDVARPLPPELSVALPAFGETLAPTYAVTQPQPKADASPWLLLVQSHSATVDLDKPASSHARGWAASAAKMLRVLRQNGSPAPVFETDDDRSALVLRLPVHPESLAAARPTAAPVTPPVGDHVLRLLKVLQAHDVMGNSEIRAAFVLKDRRRLRETCLAPALRDHLIEYTLPDRPNSRLQKYRLTSQGRALLAQLA